MQQNSKSSLCGNLLHKKRMQQISTKEYKARYVWVRKVIHWELCKKLKFDNDAKLYM